MDIKELIAIVKDGGVCGAGGAGFPSYAKLNEKADTIILNCAECEPLLKLHRQLLEMHPYEVLSTLSMMAEVLKAKEVIIGIKEAYQDTILSLEEYMGSFPSISLKLLPEIYPAGDEVVLIYEAVGKAVPPGKIPIDIGIAVFNVETIYNIYQAEKNNLPVTSKYLTVTGEVSHPCTKIVPIGMSVKEAVGLAGEITAKNPVYIMGGPMTGTVVSKNDVITKTSNAIIVLEENHLVIQKKRGNANINLKRAMASCCQCNMCTDLCPRHLLGHPIEPHAFMRGATSGTTKDVKPFLNTMFCSACGLCEMYSCMQDLHPRSLITEYKTGLKSKGIKMPEITQPRPVSRERTYRQVPVKRLTARLGLLKYDNEASLDENIIEAAQVKIMLSQHIGAPSIPVVAAGDEVKKGQLIAKAKEDALSLPVHASIDGVVSGVDTRAITIKGR